jgi:anthranilate phosphoribosyltransferase
MSQQSCFEAWKHQSNRKAMLLGVLDNQAGPARDIVVLNAGVALYAANVVPTASLAGIATCAQQAFGFGCGQGQA